jgi:DNA mismatch repair ATPase MutS
LYTNENNQDNHEPKDDNNQDDDDHDHDTTTSTNRGITTTTIPYQVLRSSSFDVQGCKKIILQKLLVESTMRRHRTGGRGGEGHYRHGANYDPARRNFQNHSTAGQSQQQQSMFAVSRYHALVSMINMESTVQVQALGALVSYLYRTQFATVTTDDGFVKVRDIVRGNLSLYMNVPSTTFTALQIFATEQHPLLGAKGGGLQSKEGFSLFSLLDKTKSRIGRQRLREWMQKPLVDIEAIESRQNGVELFLQPDLADTTGTLLNLLERVGPVDKILHRMEKAITQPQDFAVLVRSIKTATYIYDSICQDIRWPLQNHVTASSQQYVYNHNHDTNFGINAYLDFIEELLREFSPDVLQSLTATLTAAVDETATHQWDSQSIVIRTGYNEELDMLRDQYDDLGNMMQDILNNLCVEFPYLREFLDVAFFPQVRHENFGNVAD